MKAWTVMGLVLGATTAAAMACSSSGGGGGSGDGGASDAGGVTFSCTQSGIDCIQAVALPGEIPAEQDACAKSFGTFTNGTCPPGDYVGCCDKSSIQEVTCYFPEPIANDFEQMCTSTGGTWVPGDSGAPGDGGVPGDGGELDGAAGPEAFVGTWLRSGTQTVTCPTGNPTTTNITGDLVIALGSASDSIVGTQPDGCMTNYSVTGNVATAMAGQSCNTTTEAGVAEVITVTTRTFTLAADGKSLASTGSDTIDKTATGTVCTQTGSGTYTKQ
jgi:hypothetical protein